MTVESLSRVRAFLQEWDRGEQVARNGYRFLSYWDLAVIAEGLRALGIAHDKDRHEYEPIDRRGDLTCRECFEGGPDSDHHQTSRLILATIARRFAAEQDTYGGDDG